MKKCDEVLELDPENEKALFRKAETFYKLKEFNDAVKAYKKCIDSHPDNKAAKKGILTAQKAKKAFDDAEKKKYSKMFG